MRKALSGMLLAVLSLAFIVLTTGSSNADVTDLQFGVIGYNARGADNWFNRNKEYVDIKNVSSASINVKGLKVEDNWARNDDSDSTCNTYTVPSDVILAAGDTLRVYVGNGTVATNGTYHYVYMNSKPGCGYHGHIFNNLGETVWFYFNGSSASKSYGFENGYYIN